MGPRFGGPQSSYKQSRVHAHILRKRIREATLTRYFRVPNKQEGEILLIFGNFGQFLKLRIDRADSHVFLDPRIIIDPDSPF